jgi:diguanylate cyclase (GGDEF)-like protein/PAS domain S-box-containing protein
MQQRSSKIDDSSNVDVLYRLAPTGVALSLALSVVYAALIWPVVPIQRLLVWLGVSVLLAMVRLYYVHRYLHALPPLQQQRKWELGFAALAAISALLWGSIAILFFTEQQPLYQLLSFTILAGMAAAAVSTLACSPISYRVFLIFLLIPLGVRFTLQGGETYRSLAVLVAVFMVTLMAVSESVFNTMRKMRHVKHEDQYQREIMEMLANGAPLLRTLRAIVVGVEEQDPRIIASIVLLDKEQKRAFTGAAPNLPDFFNQAIDGLLIGPSVGSCGAALFTGQRVIVEDIRTHPHWADHRELALNAGLQSCWSEPIKNATGQVLGSFAIYHRVPSKPDVEDIRRIGVAAHLAGLAIERSKFEDERELAAMVYRNSSEGMVVTNADGVVIAVNEAFNNITGYTFEDIKGKGMDFSARNSADVEDYQQMMSAVLATGKWQGVLWNCRKNGERFACRVVINSIYDNTNQLSRRVILLSDITEQKRTDELIWRQANYDPLIGLPNRRLFRDRLEQEIKKALRSGRRMGLLFLDLDRFKEVNDTLGHDAGDRLLVEAAQRISSCVRDSDTVARLGGDEFTVILSEIEDNKIIERVAESIIDEMVQPFHLDEEIVYVSVSIGITVFPDDSRELEELLKYADLAMYSAKNGGRNRFSYFTSAAQKDAQQRIQMIADLRNALPAGQLSLHYQPIFDVRTHSLQKVEALLRWKHPHHGMISPTQFIPRAEESGLINEIGNWVFREVARVSRRWTKIAGADFQVSFNVSSMQLRSADACSDWLNYLVGIGVRGRNITIEINETLLLDATPHVIEVMQQFKSAGINIAIDDFGTGYSSLSYLKKFDIDYLKIDRTFVRDLAKDSDDRALAETIVVMGHKLGIKVIAEGVETYQQGHILASAGCDYAQGNLFSRPLTERDFEALLSQNSSVSVKL